jgi:hypothetical protein
VTRHHRTPRRGQRGTIMVLVITILAALLAGAAVALYLQVSSTRAAGLSSHTRSSLYCAEAGLAAGRQLVLPSKAAETALWPKLLDTDPGNNPEWYPASAEYPYGSYHGYIDPEQNTGDYDFVVTVEDNEDEVTLDTRDLHTDSDGHIIIRSRCLKYSHAPREVLELVSLEKTPGHDYKTQSGYGAGNTGNLNE